MLDEIARVVLEDLFQESMRGLFVSPEKKWHRTLRYAAIGCLFVGITSFIGGCVWMTETALAITLLCSVGMILFGFFLGLCVSLLNREK